MSFVQRALDVDKRFCLLFSAWWRNANKNEKPPILLSLPWPSTGSSMCDSQLTRELCYYNSFTRDMVMPQGSVSGLGSLIIISISFLQNFFFETVWVTLMYFFEVHNRRYRISSSKNQRRFLHFYVKEKVLSSYTVKTTFSFFVLIVSSVYFLYVGNW